MKPAPACTQHPHGFGPKPNWRSIPKEIRNGDWCVWIAKKKANGKFDKIPHNTKGPIHSNAKWLTYEQAKELYTNNPSKYNGVGRSASKNDNVAYGDIDNSTIRPSELPSTYSEYSPSNNGLRLFWTTTDKPNTDLSKPYELYFGNAQRFVTITGNRANRQKVKHVNGEFLDIVAKYKGKETAKPLSSNFPGFTPIERLEPIEHIGLTPEALDYLLHGAPVGERSELQFKAINELYAKKLNDKDILGYLTSTEAIVTALDKRNNNETRALKYLWKDCLRAKAQYIAKKEQIDSSGQTAISNYEELKRWVTQSSKEQILSNWATKILNIKEPSPVNEALVLKQISTKIQVGLRALNAELKLLRAQDPDTPQLNEEEPRTHMELAEDFINTVLNIEHPEGLIAVNHQIYAIQDSIWIRKDLENLKLRIGKEYKEPRCCRESDYKAITTLIEDELAESSSFFIDAPTGVATPKGFYRITSSGELCIEELDPWVHRAQFMLPTTPRKRRGALLHAFLNSSLPKSYDSKQQFLLQEAIGTTLFGLLPRFKKVLLFIGEGDSGKSMLQRLLEKFFSEELITSVRPSDWDNEQSRAALIGARINIAGDIPDEKYARSTIFKTITGDDRFDAKVVYKPKIVGIRNTAAHIFSANELPRAKMDKAFFDRWILIYFPVSINTSERIYKLEDLIMKQEPGELLQWALEGAQRVIQHGFTATKAQDHQRAEWEIESDSVLEFLKDTDTNKLTNDVSHDRETTKFMYLNYVGWCRVYNRKPLGRNKAIKRMAKLLARGFVNGKDYFKGIESLQNYVR